MKLEKSIEDLQGGGTRPSHRPPRQDAEKAVRTLIQWAGDDPVREGLVDTPARVIRSFEEFFAGYQIDPAELLTRTFSEVEGYDEMVTSRMLGSFRDDPSTRREFFSIIKGR